MKVEKLTLKKIFIMGVTACCLLILVGALATPLLAYYKIELASGFYALYGKICVENSSKLFFISGSPIPLCARCLGIYGGIFSTLVLYLEQIKIHKNIYYTFAFIGLAEFILEYFNLISPPILVTLAGGIFIGVFVIITVLKVDIKIKKAY